MAALTIAMTPAHAAEPSHTRPVLDAHMRATIIDSLSDELMREYVEADTARMITAFVRSRWKAGAYDTITSATRFGESVTADLRHINGDLHLSLRWDPAGPGAAGGPMIVRRTAGPGGPGEPSGMGVPAGGRRVVIEGPGSGPAGPGPGAPSGPSPPWMRDAAEHNFGLARAEILPGNVGYLEIKEFMGAPGSDDAMVAALRFLEHTDAVIFDMRRNRGGSGAMSDLLVSHFLPAKPVPTLRVKSRIEGMSRDQESIAEVPGPRRPDVPLWVLTSRGTGSAAEAFSFILKNLDRATIVGDRTAGAGHMVRAVSLPHDFVAGVSITRVSDPRTGREWEAIGVQPDVRIEPEHALAAAHAAALRKIMSATNEPARRNALAMLAEWVEARDREQPVDSARLAAFGGTYEDARTVRVVDGHLEYRRGDRMSSALVALDGARFSLEGEARIEFAPGSPSPSVTIEQPDGSRATYRRVEARD